MPDSIQALTVVHFRPTRRFLPLQRMAGYAAAGLCLLLVICAGPAALANHDEKKSPPYGLIYGTVYGPDDRPLYGVTVKVRRSDKKQAQWEMMSDHRGEFAVRVPPGPADYVVWTDAKLSKVLGTNKAQKAAKAGNNAKEGDKRSEPQAGNAAAPVASPSPGTPPKSIREVKVHVENDERIDMGLHLTE